MPAVPLEPNYQNRILRDFVVQERVAGKRIDKYLAARFADYSRSCLAGLVESGDVAVDGATVRASHKVRSGERIVVSLPVLERPHLSPDDVPLSVLYEDEWLAAIDKPAGMVVHPSRGHQRGTLVNALVARYAKLSAVRSELRPGILHRLDRDTSGVLLVAREDRAHVAIARQFEERTIEKVYLAIVRGSPELDRFDVGLPIGKHPTDRLRMAVRTATGSPASTSFRVLERFDRFTLVEARPRTGRTHQIRVHLKSQGHPIVADPLYGTRNAERGTRNSGGDLSAQPIPVERTCLHARAITFDHPVRDERITVEAPLAKDMLQFLTVLRGESDMTWNR